MSDTDYFPPDGLLPSTEQDLQVFDECFNSASSFTTLWRDNNDRAKFMKWDTEWVKYLKHRQKLLESDGKVESLPWNIYKSLGLQWSQGYAYPQGLDIGSCALFGFMNSTNASRLTSAVRLGRNTVAEINPSYAYAVSRGSGTPRWGSGCNLNPLSKWTAEIGCHLVSDVGTYDIKGSALKKINSAANANALKNQPSIIYVPGQNNTPSFDDVFLACSAGFGVVMGTSTYPKEASVGKYGLSEPTVWRNGGHSMSLAASMIDAGMRWLYLLNSHYDRYAGDKYWTKGKQPGCWINESNFMKIAHNAYYYGNWFAVVCEMGG